MSKKKLWFYIVSIALVTVVLVVELVYVFVARKDASKNNITTEAGMEMLGDHTVSDSDHTGSDSDRTGSDPGSDDLPDISILYGHDLYSKFETNKLPAEFEEVGTNEPDIERYRFDITDTGSGYELVGKLTIQDRMSDEKYHKFVEQAVNWDSAQAVVNEWASSEDYTAYDYYYTVNDTTMTNLGVTYTMQSYMTNYNDRPHCDFIGDNGKTAGVHNDLVPNIDAYDEGYWDLGGEDIVVENAHIFVPYGTNMEEIIKDLCEL